MSDGDVKLLRAEERMSRQAEDAAARVGFPRVILGGVSLTLQKEAPQTAPHPHRPVAEPPPECRPAGRISGHGSRGSRWLSRAHLEPHVWGLRRGRGAKEDALAMPVWFPVRPPGMTPASGTFWRLMGELPFATSPACRGRRIDVCHSLGPQEISTLPAGSHGEAPPSPVCPVARQNSTAPGLQRTTRTTRTR
jgi:hypothetical protein